MSEKLLRQARDALYAMQQSAREQKCGLKICDDAIIEIDTYLRQLDTLYEHKKTGGVYELVCFGLLESDKTPVTVYRNYYTREAWVRPASEFNDGRFEKILPPSPNQ